MKKEIKTVSEIKPAPYNPRQISDKKLSQLEKTMKEFGDISGIVINLETGNQVTGHQRCKKLNPSWEIVKEAYSDNTGTVAQGYVIDDQGVKWSYREVYWPLEKEKAANIAANNSGGKNDKDSLKELLFELDDMNFDLELTGFNNMEVERLLNDSHLDPKPTKDNSQITEVECSNCGHKIHVLHK